MPKPTHYVVDDNGNMVPGYDDDAVVAAPSYESMSRAELEAEIAKRNDGRGPDNPLPVPGKGNKPDLVAALVAHDAETAAPGTDPGNGN